MKKQILVATMVFWGINMVAQPTHPDLVYTHRVKSSSIEDQGQTGTCWSFGVAAFVESLFLQNNKTAPNLSEMWWVRNVYLEKANNYILRQGKAPFSEGAMVHDGLSVLNKYGAMPEEFYTGNPDEYHDHALLYKSLRQYVDSVLQLPRPISADWKKGYAAILDKHLGTPPTEFEYKGVNYTPLTFSRQYLGWNKEKAICVTSFTHQPYHKEYQLEVADRFSDARGYNVPLVDYLALIDNCIQAGYALIIDTDVSNDGFDWRRGFAMLKPKEADAKWCVGAAEPEGGYSPEQRQLAFETMSMQDDHTILLIGRVENSKGDVFYCLKNSWGDTNYLHGYIFVSRAYLAQHSFSVIIPREILSAYLSKTH